MVLFEIMMLDLPFIINIVKTTPGGCRYELCNSSCLQLSSTFHGIPENPTPLSSLQSQFLPWNLEARFPMSHWHIKTSHVVLYRWPIEHMVLVLSPVIVMHLVLVWMCGYYNCYQRYRCSRRTEFKFGRSQLPSLLHTLPRERNVFTSSPFYYGLNNGISGSQPRKKKTLNSKPWRI